MAHVRSLTPGWAAAAATVAVAAAVEIVAGEKKQGKEERVRLRRGWMLW